MAEQKGVIVNKAGEIPMQNVYLVVLGGMLINAFISPFLSILIAKGMNTVTITFWRLFIVGATLMPVVLAKKESRQELTSLRSRDIPMLSFYCFTKTCSFLLFAEALRAGAQAFTVSILTNVTPIWMVIFLFIFFREKTPWQSLIGIAICLCGIFYVGSENIAQLGGDFLSVAFGMLSAATNAANTLTGRSLRQKMGFTTLLGFSYLVSSILAFLYALLVGAGFYVPRDALLVLALLSWGCTMCGHSANIWAVKYANPITLSLMSLGSPFFTAITSFFLLDQVPGLNMLFGALIVVFGLAINILAGHRVKVRQSTPPIEDTAANMPEVPEDNPSLPETFSAASPSPCFEGEESST